MYAISNTTFRFKVVPTEVVFDDVTRGGSAQNAFLHLKDGSNVPLRRISIIKPTADRLKSYEGHYYSAELGVIYDVFVRENRLMMRYPRGELDLKPFGTDAFVAGFPIGKSKSLVQTIASAIHCRSMAAASNSYASTGSRSTRSALSCCND